MNQKYGVEWTRDELILALYYYCQIPFARTKANNPDVIRLASIIGRSPSSVARKLGNFGAFDPVLAKRGISGLTHYSKMDRAVWGEFTDNWEALVRESQRVLSSLGVNRRAESLWDESPLRLPTGETERRTVGVQRVYQDFFRRSVLSGYEFACCVCGADLPSLLVASHIIPWAVDKQHRLNPENGLCLCALHDRAYDSGVLGIDDHLILLVSREARRSRSEFVKTAIVEFADKPLRPPRRFFPRVEFLKWHFQNIFARQTPARLTRGRNSDIMLVENGTQSRPQSR